MKLVEELLRLRRRHRRLATAVNALHAVLHDDEDRPAGRVRPAPAARSRRA